jgi:3-deoxy-D-manno-octulosonic-acid transferase
VGNIKYDAAKLAERRMLDIPALIRQLGAPDGARLLVAGSTHAGEESIVGEVFKRLKSRFPELFLVVVPRHFERGKEAGKELTNHGIRFAYRSEMSVNTRYKPNEVEALLVNTTGELKYFYEHAAAVFVGKSLTAEGGQNPIEPAALGKPIVFGPNMQNFQTIAKAFVEQNAAVEVRDANELEQAWAAILSDPNKATEMGRAAIRVVRENQGAMERTVDMIVEHIDARDIYVAPKRDAV